MPDVIIGGGEVGSALAEVLEISDVHDLRYPIDPFKAEVMHIAFPWSETFTEDVRIYQRHFGASLVIVHSTVPVGTCDPEGWVHSPVTGRHPDLVESLYEFRKTFGGRQALTASAIWQARLGLTSTYEHARTTEAQKLWSLVQFGLQVKVSQAIHDWCELNNLDWDEVYLQAGRHYNDGYVRLGEEQFIRPLLEYVPGPIGGHCVRQGAALLDHPLAEWVAES